MFPGIATNLPSGEIKVLSWHGRENDMYVDTGWSAIGSITVISKQL